MVSVVSAWNRTHKGPRLLERLAVAYTANLWYWTRVKADTVWDQITSDCPKDSSSWVLIQSYSSPRLAAHQS